MGFFKKVHKARNGQDSKRNVRLKAWNIWCFTVGVLGIGTTYMKENTLWFVSLPLVTLYCSRNKSRTTCSKQSYDRIRASVDSSSANPPEVDLIPSFSWSCPECGEHNVINVAYAEVDAEVARRLMEKHGGNPEDMEMLENGDASCEVGKVAREHQCSECGFHVEVNPPQM